MKDRIMLKSIGAIALVLFSISALLANPFPPKKDWEYLGAKNIGLTYEKDVLYMKNSRDLYSAIELKTDKKQIDLHRCVIYFENGDRQEVRLRRDNRGSESHLIELQGRAKAIDRIAIWGSRDYGKIFNAFDKGTVEVWGKVVARRDYDEGDVQYYSADRYDNYDRDYNRNNLYNDQARRDRERAQRDRERAQRDRDRARRDREQAERAREQARRDRNRRDRNRNRRNGRFCP